MEKHQSQAYRRIAERLEVVADGIRGLAGPSDPPPTRSRYRRGSLPYFAEKALGAKGDLTTHALAREVERLGFRHRHLCRRIQISWSGRLRGWSVATLTSRSPPESQVPTSLPNQLWGSSFEHGKCEPEAAQAQTD